MLKRLSAYSCNSVFTLPPIGATSHLLAFIKATVCLSLLLCLCVTDIRVYVRVCLCVCVCVCLWIKDVSGLTRLNIIQVEARDCVTFSLQVTERAEKKRLEDANKMSKKRDKFFSQVVAVVTSSLHTFFCCC